MRFGSICSGIEAASVAGRPLGWQAAWLAEVDVAASAVLAHRLGATAPQFAPEFEDDPAGKRNGRTGAQKRATWEKAQKKIAWGDRITNWGDLTRLPELVRSGAAEAPEALVGGTPCQSFSVAGNRKGMADPRGGLSLAFVDLADAIDEVRETRGEPPCVIMWENVDGVLSHRENPFGCFLAALVGEDVPIEPPGGKWKNAGYVAGPQRSVAWRVGDAQYFGLAQRRNRVYVVASARDGFDPAGILFEWEGVRRDTPPSREAGETVAGSLTGSLGRRGGKPDGGDTSGHLIVAERPAVAAFGGGDTRGELSVATTTTTKTRIDFDTETFVVHGYANAGHFGSMVSVEISDPLRTKGGDTGGGGETLVVHGLQDPIVQRDCAMPLSRKGAGGDNAVLSFSCKDYGADVSRDVAPTLRAMNHSASHANAGGQLAVLTVSLRGREGVGVAELGGDVSNALRSSGGGGDKAFVLIPPPVYITGEITHALKSEGFDASEDGTGRGQPIVPCGASIRRLMPIECERLQGFPDNWTLVPVGNKPAADGPRYRQLGNSWAVPHARWVMGRIDAEIARLAADSEPPLDDEVLLLWLLAA